MFLKSGTRCRFRLADVICPDKQQVSSQITPELEVSGEIVLFSDGDNEPQQYAIIEVEGIAAPLIVPVARLQATAQQKEDAKEAPATVETRYEKVGKS
jgi:hypothetical protein